MEVSWTKKKKKIPFKIIVDVSIAREVTEQTYDNCLSLSLRFLSTIFMRRIKENNIFVRCTTHHVRRAWTRSTKADIAHLRFKCLLTFLIPYSTVRQGKPISGIVFRAAVVVAVIYVAAELAAHARNPEDTLSISNEQEGAQRRQEKRAFGHFWHHSLLIREKKLVHRKNSWDLNARSVELSVEKRLHHVDT